MADKFPEKINRAYYVRNGRLYSEAHVNGMRLYFAHPDSDKEKYDYIDLDEVSDAKKKRRSWMGSALKRMKISIKKLLHI